MFIFKKHVPRRAMLKGAKFQDFSATDSNFTEATLADAMFHQSRLYECNLMDADLIPRADIDTRSITATPSAAARR